MIWQNSRLRDDARFTSPWKLSLAQPLAETSARSCLYPWNYTVHDIVNATVNYTVTIIFN
jgi:hypothetical protein